jgi:uncharacterized protein
VPVSCEVPMMTTTLPAIDADGHILERTSEILPYLEGRWKQRHTALWPGCQPWDTNLFETLGNTENYRGDLSAKGQVRSWHRILDENEIAFAVLFPTGSGNVGKLQEQDFAAAVCRACNDHFAADYADARLRPVGVLPMRNAQAAADELRRAASELGLVGFEILTTGLPFAIGDPYFDPVFRAAEELGVTLCVHGTRHWAHEFGAGILSTFSEVHAYAFPAGVLLHFASVLGQGLPVRFPKLRMAFLEVGATWLPYYLDRLDEHWEKRGAVDMPLLNEKPSALFKRSNIKVSIEADETLLPQTIEAVGIEHFVFATDVPHWDCEFPGNLRHLRGHRGITTEQKQRILYGNAKELFNL